MIYDNTIESHWGKDTHTHKNSSASAGDIERPWINFLSWTLWIYSYEWNDFLWKNSQN